MCAFRISISGIYVDMTERIAESTSISQAPTTQTTTDAIISETNDKVEDEVDPTTARKKLERKLSLRPEKKDLVERNILKGASFD